MGLQRVWHDLVTEQQQSYIGNFRVGSKIRLIFPPTSFLHTYNQCIEKSYHLPAKMYPKMVYLCIFPWRSLQSTGVVQNNLSVSPLYIYIYTFPIYIFTKYIYSHFPLLIHIWLNSITDSVDMKLSKLWEIVEDRGAWHAVVHGVAKRQTWLSDWTTARNKWQITMPQNL